MYLLHVRRVCRTFSTRHVLSHLCPNLRRHSTRTIIILHVCASWVVCVYKLIAALCCNVMCYAVISCHVMLRPTMSCNVVHVMEDVVVRFILPNRLHHLGQVFHRKYVHLWRSVEGNVLNNVCKTWSDVNVRATPVNYAFVPPTTAAPHSLHNGHLTVITSGQFYTYANTWQSFHPHVKNLGACLSNNVKGGIPWGANGTHLMILPNLQGKHNLSVSWCVVIYHDAHQYVPTKTTVIPLYITSWRNTHNIFSSRKSVKHTWG